MTRATYIIGDTLAVLPTLEPASVDTVICSPPFLALRSYLPADHLDKPLEHGSEATPAAFLANLLDVTELCGRALAPHGSLAVELGDTFSGSGGSGGDYLEDGLREGQPRVRSAWKPSGWPLAKSLCFVPQLYGASLAYGRNLLAQPGSPEWREFAPWRVRNLIAWVRPNPPVGALGDKWRPATSYITVATRSATRWWDDIPTRKDNGNLGATRRRNNNDLAESRVGVHEQSSDLKMSNPAGASLLDWWEITPTGFTSHLGAHYATFPDAIVTPLVQAMCPRRVCRTCGTPSRRLFDVGYVDLKGRPAEGVSWSSGIKDGKGAHSAKTATRTTTTTTVGWSTCGCPGTEHTREDGFHEGPGWRPGLVLDPYAGTGTTLLVSTGHGRDTIGIDLDARNAVLAEERIGMFLTIEEAVA